MAYNHEYPYVDPNRYNADWILNKIKELEGEMTEFEALNKITFDGEWDITKQYPAWCIVNTNGGQEGYISLKPVPAGVTIDNTEYWTSIVNYTATIADLQNRVIALEAAVDDINDVLDLMNHKRYVFIGDSYNTTDPGGEDPILPWSTKLIEYLGLAAGDYYTIGHSGSGFAHGSEPFINLLNTISASVTDKDTITDVVVLGGVNDISESLSDINTALNAFIARATELYPNAKITLGFISWSRNLTTRALMLPIMTYYEQMAKYPNVQVISDAYKFYHNYLVMYQSDGHPNATGSAEIAMGIANFLRGGSTCVHWTSNAENLAMDSALNITGGTVPTLQFTQLDKVVVTRFVANSWMSSSGFSISTDNEYTLGGFNYQVADFNAISPISGAMYVRASGTFYTLNVRLLFEHNTIKFRVLEVNGSGTSTINNVDLIKFNLPDTFITPIEEC